MEYIGNNKDFYWLWFNQINIATIEKTKLLQKYTVEELYNLREKIFEICNDKYILNAKQLQKSIQQNGIGIIDICSNEYPASLKKIYDPPIILYFKGKKEVLQNRGVSIFVGKNVDNYGKKILKQLTTKLVKEKISLVTKFEEYDKGIFLNNTSNENILVLSSGIKENMYSRGGIVISEHAPYVDSNKENIFKRNRIISGLTEESILLQMTVSDGVSYIVDTALEQNKELWVIPGDITKSQNYYTNELIKHGANVLTQYTDLFIYDRK